jgi:hypothetical protein
MQEVELRHVNPSSELFPSDSFIVRHTEPFQISAREKSPTARHSSSVGHATAFKESSRLDGFVLLLISHSEPFHR